MNAPLICHFLVGPPGCGKSSFAQQLVKIDSATQIVSTDAIRAELFGNESVQGNWADVEAKVFEKMRFAIACGHPVVYDATNAKRAWRTSTLMQLADCENVVWVAWHLKTPLLTCKAWNRNRQRQVLEAIIESMSESLKNFPPLPAEGFAAVYPICLTDGSFSIEQVKAQIEKLPRAIANRKNRTGNITPHRYSRLLDFDRLMHLISLIVRYPGLGNLQEFNPETFHKLLGAEAQVSTFSSALDEICAAMSKQHSPLYADKSAIARDLEWLENNGIIGTPKLDAELEIPDCADNAGKAIAHAYSDRETFKRLLKTIRYIAHNPFLQNPELGSLQTLLIGLQQHGVYTSLPSLRKDIEEILKPYKILPSSPMKRGYFIGTGILGDREIKEVFRVLKSQAENLEDPVSLGVYPTFKERLTSSNLLDAEDLADLYPVRAIGNQAIYDINSLPDCAIYRNLKYLENSIENGELLEIQRIPGTGRFADDPHQSDCFRVWPLQILFHNIGWYLGYECNGGEPPHLFKFERLDRIYGITRLGQQRTKSEQRESLHKLEILYKASAGLFLGNSAAEQAEFLNSDKSKRASVEITVEIWCTDEKFKFISEGTKRFPASQMKMSARVGGSKQNLKKTMFSLPKTSDPNFPNRLKITLPKWSLGDIDLIRWIIGFGGHVKVIEPNELVQQIKNIAESISRLYLE